MTLVVFRIGTNKATTLDSLSFGSTLESGRWHRKPPEGLPVVYAGGSRAICQLGKRVHCNGVAPIGLVMLALRHAGEAAGWGFQMQSPVFVGAMALLFVLIGLNLFGVFETGVLLTRLAPAPSSSRVLWEVS